MPTSKSALIVLLAFTGFIFACSPSLPFGHSEKSETEVTSISIEFDVGDDFILEKVSEMSGSFISQVCKIIVDPLDYQSVLIWSKFHEANSGIPIDILSVWKGLPNIFSDTKPFVYFEPIIALSNIHAGSFDIVSLQLPEIIEEGRLNYVRGNYVTKSVEAKNLKHDQSKIAISQVNPIDRDLCTLGPVHMEISDNGKRIVLVKSAISLDLMLYSNDGDLLKVNRLRAPEPVSEFMYNFSTLRISKSGFSVVIFKLPNEQIRNFEKEYGIILEPAPENSKTLAIFDENGLLQRASRFSWSSMQEAVWIDDTTLAVLTKKDIMDIGSAAEIRLIYPSSEKKDRIIPITDVFEKGTFDFKSIHAMPNDRVLITANVDWVQAPTGSLVNKGKVFVGIFDLKTEKFIFRRKIHGQRHLRSAAVTERSPGEFLIAIAQGPLTHDQHDRSVQSYIYSLRSAAK